MECVTVMQTSKVVVITGAGSGIGAATARRFARDGFSVVLNGRTAAKLERVAAELPAGRALVVPGDVGVAADTQALVERTLAAFGRLDVLVNNAATVVIGGLEAVSLEDWNHQFAVNTTGVFTLTRAALPHLRQAGGAVVNVSSVSGLGGDWGLFSYNATKGAVSLLTQALALELGGQGVRVNAVAPSLTRTEMTAGLLESEELVRRFADRIPMGRAAEPEEVADVIAFLAGHDARFVNGVVLPVDGGLSASNGQPRVL